MRGLPGRGITPEDRVDAVEYLRDVHPHTEVTEREFLNWMQIACPTGRTLSLETDPSGEHAGVYLWRVSEAARDFVQHETARAARRYFEAYALCLEARAAAADLFREGVELAAVKDPTGKIAEANHKLAEATRHATRAQTAMRLLQQAINGPHST